LGLFTEDSWEDIAKKDKKRLAKLKAKKDALKWTARGKTDKEVIEHYNKVRSDEARKEQGVYKKSGEEKRKEWFAELKEKFLSRKKKKNETNKD
jgi:hypothetical protein